MSAHVSRGNIRIAKKQLNKEDREAAAQRKSSIEDALARQDLEFLLKQWMIGADIDWDRLYVSRRPLKVGLPTYPFAKKRYWFDDADAVAPVALSDVEISPAPARDGNTVSCPTPDLNQRFEQLLGGLRSSAPTKVISVASN
jgi:acyl transferase domain-containing protein